MERVISRRIVYYTLFLSGVSAVFALLFTPICQAVTASYGQPWHGALVNGVRFPDMFPGYRLLFKNKTCTTPELAGAVLDAVQAVRAKFPGTCDLVIGEFSKEGGGPFPPHASHQNGRDVDIGFYAKDNRPLDNLMPMNRDNLDAAKSLFLIQRLVASQRVQYIFLGRSVQKILYDYGLSHGYSRAYLNRLFGEVPGALVEAWPNHVNHMCVRFFTPWSTLAARIGPDKSRMGSIIAMAQESYMPKKILYYVTGRERGLKQLAESFGVRESELCAWNRLSRFDMLVPGSCLVYYRRSFESESVQLACSLQPGYIAQLASPAVMVASLEPQSASSTMSDTGKSADGRQTVPRVAPEAARPAVLTLRRNRAWRKDVPKSGPGYDNSYIVQHGGTLRSVSEKTGIPLDELCRLNRLSRNSALKAGWKIKLPQSHPAADESASICFASDSGKKSMTSAYYRVAQGGTLREVAQKTGLSLSALCKLNRLGPDVCLRRGRLVKLAEVNMPVRPFFGRASCSLGRSTAGKSARQRAIYRKRLHRAVVRNVSYRLQNRSAGKPVLRGRLKSE